MPILEIVHIFVQSLGMGSIGYCGLVLVVVPCEQWKMGSALLYFRSAIETHKFILMSKRQFQPFFIFIKSFDLSKRKITPFVFLLKAMPSSLSPKQILFPLKPKAPI